MLPYCIFKTCAKESIQDIATWYVSMKLGVLVRHWMAEKLDHKPKLTSQPKYPYGMGELLEPQKTETKSHA